MCHCVGIWVLNIRNVCLYRNKYSLNFIAISHIMNPVWCMGGISMCLSVLFKSVIISDIMGVMGVRLVFMVLMNLMPRKELNDNECTDTA